MGNWGVYPRSTLAGLPVALISDMMSELKDLVPYRKEPTAIIAGIQWYKVVDKNGVPLVNFDIAEDKADFICKGVNNFDGLLAACKKARDEIIAGDPEQAMCILTAAIAKAQPSRQSVAPNVSGNKI